MCPLFLGVAQCPVAVVHPFIDLDFVHRVSGQILDRHLGAAREEVLAVHEQAVHPAAVHRDDPVFFQFHAGQHGDELVEHRPFGQLEGVGVVDERVPFHHHHQLRGLHGRFAELDFFPWAFLHKYVSDIYVFHPIRTKSEVLFYIRINKSFRRKFKNVCSRFVDSCENPHRPGRCYICTPVYRRTVYGHCGNPYCVVYSIIRKVFFCTSAYGKFLCLGRLDR